MQVSPYIVGITGGSSSGKSEIARHLATLLREDGLTVTEISLDMFYKDVPVNAQGDEYDWDDPAALDFDAALRCLETLRAGKHCEVYEHDFITYGHKSSPTVINTADVYIFEGIHVGHDERIRKMFNLFVFVECDLDMAFARRIVRDTSDPTRKKPLEVIVERWRRFVKTNYLLHIAKVATAAAVRISNEKNKGVENVLGVHIIREYVSNHCRRRPTPPLPDHV